MGSTSELADRFENQDIHALWESVYRKNQLQRSFNDQLMKRFLRWLQLPAGGRVLDAGCGVGDHTFRFAKAGFHCVGVDLSEQILEHARRQAQTLGLAEKTMFVRAGLEDLTDLKADFDAVHCRGVLMHIPRWEAALSELCRLLKPGGRIVILENNVRSVECLCVKFVRLIRRSESRLEKTPGGWVFHNSDAGQAPITRIANIDVLKKELGKNGVKPVARFATEFWDLNRFPGGLIRNGVVIFNRAYFHLRLPALLSLGNALMGRKV